MRLKNFETRLKLVETRKVKPPPKQADSFYGSTEWKQLMAEIIKERGRCCEDRNCKTPNGPWGRIYGHHIVEIKYGGAPLDKRNVLLVCAPCHGVVTAKERRNRGKSSLAGFS